MKFFCRIKKDFKNYQLGENNFECIIFEFVLKYINWNFWWGKLIRLLFSSVVLPGFFMWKVVSRVVVFDSVAKLVVLGGLKEKELNFLKILFPSLEVHVACGNCVQYKEGLSTLSSIFVWYQHGMGELQRCFNMLAYV